VADFYQLDPGLDEKSWKEKLNFVLRQIFKRLDSVDSAKGGVKFTGPLDMGGYPIINGPANQSKEPGTDFATIALVKSLAGAGGVGGGSVSTAAPLTGGGVPPITISILKATAAVDGYISATDWVIFNAKVGGSGTIGTLPKFTAAGTIGDSVIKEAAGKIGLGTPGAPAYKLEVQGQIKATAGSILPAVANLADAATIVTDASLGNHFRVTLGGNRTLGNVTTPVDGQRFIWEFLQDGSGNRTITLDSKFVVPNNVPPVILTLTPNRWSLLAGIYNSILDKVIITGFLQDYA
jgi:hypothetical protein